MKKYHYQETLNINVEVYAKSKKEAQDKVASALAWVFERMPNIDEYDKSIGDNSFDTIEITVTEEN